MIKLSWVKFYMDFFDDARVQVIETMPDADAIYSVWFKLLAFVGKQNSNGVFLIHTGGDAEDLPITEEVISTVTHRPITTVRLALSTFEHLGLIERVDGVYAYTDWDRLVDQQRLRSLEERREQKALGAAERKRSKEETVRAYVAEHPDASQVKIARETGIPRSTVQRCLKSLKALPTAAQNGVPTPAHKGAQMGCPHLPTGLPMGTQMGTLLGTQNPQVDAYESGGAHSKIENKMEDIDTSPSSSDAAVDNLTGRGAAHPTLAEVRAFYSEQRLRIDPDRFFAVNEGRGWVTTTGKPVDDWKGLAVKWDQNQTSPAPSAARREAPKGKKALPSVEEVMQIYSCGRETAEEMLRDPFFTATTD